MWVWDEKTHPLPHIPMDPNTVNPKHHLHRRGQMFWIWPRSGCSSAFSSCTQVLNVAGVAHVTPNSELPVWVLKGSRHLHQFPTRGQNQLAASPWRDGKLNPRPRSVVVVPWGWGRIIIISDKKCLMRPCPGALRRTGVLGTWCREAPNQWGCSTGFTPFCPYF